MPDGGCHCRAVRYTVSGEPAHAALCHCRDCTHLAGAAMVGWAMFPREAVTIAGETRGYASSEHGRRQFCPTCGTGLFYTNDAVFPGMIDVQLVTLDDSDACPPGVHLQVADDPRWMAAIGEMPRFERYPG